RDIKPENILLDRRGQLKVADFGLSKLLGMSEPDLNLTGTYQVMGTPRYMAPEQMEQSKNVDHRADIYSLGVIFYEMLTGELPLGRFASPSEKTQIDVRLDEVVLRTLEREPERRYQHASEVKDDLDSISTSKERAPISPPEIQNAEEALPSSPSGEKVSSAQVILLRDRLIERVRGALRPLLWGQLAQVVFGILLTGFYIFMWTRHTDIPHQLACGIIMHVYGVVLIGLGANAVSKIRGLDYAPPVANAKEQLSRIRSRYLISGSMAGLAWWLLWIPAAIGMGFDQMLWPQALWPSLIVGIVGLAVCFGIAVWLVRPNAKNRKKWLDAISAKSLVRARQALDELDEFDRTR
ncbi:MAG: serine/threonine protein kinase, partial [Verrucomicrobiae bacterium]|nr:serine/threonine protein kinase [Verrucomicrobiae bacterium]